jgi:DNA-directed RNA polymerase specialized sigma24 family protein
MLGEDAERTIASRIEGSPQPEQERPGTVPAPSRTSTASTRRPTIGSLRRWSHCSAIGLQPRTAFKRLISEPELVRELRALPSKQAAALVLRHLHGYGNREIAHALGVPKRTIASRLAAARSRIQARLVDPGEAESGTWQQPSVSSDK